MVISDRQLVQTQHQIAATAAGSEIQPDGFPSPHVFQALHPLQTFQPALGLLRPLASDVALDEILFFGDERLLPFVFSAASRQTLRLEQHRLAVIARVGLEPSPLKLPDAIYHVVEESAVVGHGDERPRPIFQIALEPFDSIDIEMVGRLVQQQ